MEKGEGGRQTSAFRSTTCHQPQPVRHTECRRWHKFWQLTTSNPGICPKKWRNRTYYTRRHTRIVAYSGAFLTSNYLGEFPVSLWSKSHALASLIPLPTWPSSSSAKSSTAILRNLPCPQTEEPPSSNPTIRDSNLKTRQVLYAHSSKYSRRTYTCSVGRQQNDTPVYCDKAYSYGHTYVLSP